MIKNKNRKDFIKEIYTTFHRENDQSGPRDKQEIIKLYKDKNILYHKTHLNMKKYNINPHFDKKFYNVPTHFNILVVCVLIMYYYNNKYKIDMYISEILYNTDTKLRKNFQYIANLITSETKDFAYNFIHKAQPYWSNLEDKSYPDFYVSEQQAIKLKQLSRKNKKKRRKQKNKIKRKLNYFIKQHIQKQKTHYIQTFINKHQQKIIPHFDHIQATQFLAKRWNDHLNLI